MTTTTENPGVKACIFQPWFATLSRTRRIILIDSQGALTFCGADNAKKLARFIRNSIMLQADGSTIATPITDSIDPLFGSTIDLENLINDNYVADYRARVASGVMPKSDKEFGEAMLADLKTNWPNYTTEYEQALIAEVSSGNAGIVTVIHQASAVLGHFHPNLLVRTWWMRLHTNLCKSMNLTDLSSVEKLDIIVM